jgi:hypothetical protein
MVAEVAQFLEVSPHRLIYRCKSKYDDLPAQTGAILSANESEFVLSLGIPSREFPQVLLDRHSGSISGSKGHRSGIPGQEPTTNLTAGTTA